jgi:cation diffusion facilitator family transporter
MVQDPNNARTDAIARTAAVGAVVNLALSIIKVAAGIYGQSQALVADGIHSFSDLVSDALVWFAGKHAAQSPDREHPYGHGRYETVATLVLGALLALVAVGIGWDAADRLFSPEELLRPAPMALYAALASILIKEWLYWYTLAYARRIQSQMLRANAWHHRSDAISSVVVLVGVAGTMAGLPYLDAIAAFLVAVMIGHIAWELGRDAVRELVDTGLDDERLDLVRQTILSVGGVRDVHMLRTRRLGGYASADVHILVDPRVSVSEGHMISVLVERRLKDQIDEVADVTVHIDPEDDEAAPSGALPLRAEAMVRLSRLWDGIPEAALRHQTTLHYLNGRIDVDAYLPLDSCGGDAARARSLRDRLQAALQADPVFNHVSIFFG